MRFHYNQIILWMKNGNIRTLNFLPNKVNIITGGSETGKSAILAIIDYCFFADRNIKITQEFINENVEWYGINYCINNKVYTIARRSMNVTIPSTDYYFSLIGKVPQMPHSSISEKDLKKFMNEEFSINENTIVPYGGKQIKAGSKISMKYFMLFNSQDENTIDNSDIFFDKQTDSKYQEALERTFDLAVGISNEKNVLINEKINSINKEINKYQRKQNTIDNKVSAFENEKLSLIKKAKMLNLIPNDILNVDECINIILDLAKGNSHSFADESNKILDELSQKEKKIKRDIKIINDFLNQANNYTNLNNKNLDSLKPIQYLADNYGELINHASVVDIMNGLQYNYSNMLKKISRMKKSDYGMKEELKNLYYNLSKVREEINKFSIKEDNTGIIDKYIFLGEAKTKIEIYRNNGSIIDFKDKIEELEGELKLLEISFDRNEDRRTSIIKLVEISAKALMERCKSAMETYGDYVPVLNYKEKKLELMNPKIAQIAKVVGSSSNYLFLHLFFILSLHEVIMAQKIKYIPSYIILDQPSRPYYDNKNEEFRDKEKITIAISLLNDYIDLINNEYKEEFQFIVFEHIPKEIWKDMRNINLVEEFINGNKLIRKCDITRK
ncbi:DUF3732 domain-containing protein [Clostridium sp. UBA5119]|uniref:DUF3732 domain-containing protein n=1 Tax=Clostridium sp. UBA5119 TaxID=1946366 RepID=UPI00321683EF